MNTVRYILIASAFAHVACSSEPAADLPSPDGPIELSMRGHVAAGEEIFRCRYVVLPEGKLDIVRFEHSYTPGSHHILLYPTTFTAEDVADDLEEFDCLSRGDLGQTGVAYGADEQPVGEQEFPPGIAMHFESEAVVLLEAHYLNASDQDLDVDVQLKLHPATEPVTDYAGTLFYYNWSIMVPPAPGEATAKMRCVVPEDVEMLYATSHMHRRGTAFRSWLSGGDVTEPVPLHQSEDWESPIADVFWPPLQIKAGQTIEFECDYRNDLPHTVVEGESADTNEMCMFIASYWPQMDLSAEYCLVEDSGPVLSGSSTCSETLECLDRPLDEIALQECLQGTCSGSSSALSGFLLCLDSYGCEDDACIERNCLDEYFTCEAASCE